MSVGTFVLTNTETRLMDGILHTIGNTPLVKLTKVFRNIGFNLYAKLEAFNPGGSVKDRAALKMLERAIESGQIHQATTIIESSSGNMAIGLAQACAYFGLRLICVVDAKTTTQNRRILRAYGAEVDVVTEVDLESGELLQGRLKRVEHLLRTIADSFCPNQYKNPYNARAHHKTMQEIADFLHNRVDYLFCSTSTCGTIRGCSEYISNNGLRTKVIAVDAVGSVIFGGESSKRLIPGHGAAVRPALFKEGMAERCVHVTDLDCVVGCRRLVQKEGILAGGSSGAVLSAVRKMAQEIPDGANSVVILPDRGERYLETIYSDEWVAEHFGDISNQIETVAAFTRQSPAGASISGGLLSH